MSGGPRGALEAAPAEALPDVPREGLSLAALRAFAEAHAGTTHVLHPGAQPLPFEQLTTAQVCAAVVKPATLARGPHGAGCTYAELLLAQARAHGRTLPLRLFRAVNMPFFACAEVLPLRAPVTRTTSLTWRAPRALCRTRGRTPSRTCLRRWRRTLSRTLRQRTTGSVRAALLAHLAEQPVDALDAATAADVFVASQHRTEQLPQEWWSGAFRQSVVDIGRTVLVLQPWDAPVPLMRSWCLWEIFSTLDGGAELQIALTPAQRDSFHDAFVCAHFSLGSSLGALTFASQDKRFDDIESAMCKIDVRAASAFDEADKLMIGAAVRASAGGFEAVNGRIHDRLREWLADASRDLLAKRRVTLGNAHPDTLASMNNLAILLKAQGKLSKAEPLYRDALRCRRETLGDTHPDTLTSMNNLASLLSDQGKLSEAEPLCRDALCCRREALGETHPDTLTSMNNLATLLSDQGKLSEAEPLCRDALCCSRETLGETHPDTLSSKYNLAWFLHALPGRAAEAVALARESARGHEADFGVANVKTLKVLDTLAAVLDADGCTDDAAAVRARIAAAKCTADESTGDAHVGKRQRRVA